MRVVPKIGYPQRKSLAKEGGSSNHKDAAEKRQLIGKKRSLKTQCYTHTIWCDCEIQTCFFMIITADVIIG